MTPPQESHTLRAIALFLAAMLLFAALDATSKHLTESFPVPMLVWARYAVHLLLMLVFLAPSMRLRLVQTRRPLSQVVRALMLTAVTGFAMAALQRMPLAETTAIVFVTPLLVTVLAVLVLKERVSLSRWAAVALGLAGVLVIARPGAGLDLAGLAFALAAALCYSIYQILTRQLAASEHAVTMLFYTALVGTAVMTAALPWYWEDLHPSWPESLMLVSMGIYGGTGHYLLTRAFHMAPASVLSPFLYVQLVWAALLGWLVFGDFPDALSLMGMAVIAAGGLAVALGARR